MTTPYTLMRCRMKHLISCFNARKQDPDESDNQKPTASSIGDNNRKVEIGTAVEKDRGGEESPASWQSCESEENDYITFHFKDDDGGGDIIEESSSERKQEVIRRKKKNVPKTKQLNEYESEQHRDPLGESSDSSTSSFAFPAVQQEWTGSPVLMPRPEGYNKSGGVCVQCCKF